MRNLIHFTMAPQTDTELLAERLDAIRSEKAALMKKVEELDADEQRIKYALDVFRSVLGERAQAPEPKAAVALSGHATIGMTATGTLSVGSSAPTVVVQGGQQRPKQTLEELIMGAFEAKDGITSIEVAELVQMFTDAKPESIKSTLSRMGGKGLVRRDGRLYFRGKKGEGSTVGTDEPSSATTSGDGQHTSSAPIDEEGDLA